MFIPSHLSLSQRRFLLGLSTLLILIGGAISILLLTQENQDIRQQAAGSCGTGQTEVTKKICSGDPTRSCETTVLDGTTYEGDILCSVWNAGSCTTTTSCECPSGQYFCGAQGSCGAACRDTGGLGCQEWLNLHCGTVLPSPTVTPGGEQPGTPPTPTIAACSAPAPASASNLLPSGRIKPGVYPVQWQAGTNANAYDIYFDDLRHPWSAASDCTTGENGDTCTLNFPGTSLGSAEFKPGMAWDYYVISKNTCGLASNSTKVTVAVESSSCNSFCTIDENCAHLGSGYTCHNNTCRHTACIESEGCSCVSCSTAPPAPKIYWPWQGVQATPGERVIRWYPVQTASSYRIRIDDLSNGWDESTCSTTLDHSKSDWCISNIQGNGYQSSDALKTWSAYYFKDKHRYAVWVEAVNACGASVPSEVVRFAVGMPYNTNTPTRTPTLSISQTISPTPTDTVTRTPSITRTPTISPTHTPTGNIHLSPTPFQAGSCNGITMNYGNTDAQRPPRLGDQVSFTCGEISGAFRYQFRVIQSNIEFAKLEAIATGSRISQPYPLSIPGIFTAQCRACSSLDDSSCQPWQ